ncbi:MAG: methyl-accepting chemotaxis protein, partial [Spirochaetes bacterium]|nr:methyl-accepting chemotaxis protein [Spirochaetota bacterium]
MKKFFLYIIFLLSCIENIIPAGETSVINDTDVTLINFIFKETEKSEITPAEILISLNGFCEYKNGLVPYTVDKNNRQLIFVSNLNISERFKEADLSFYSGPSLYPFDVYFNNHKIAVIGEYKQYYNGYNYISKNIYLQKDLINYNADNHLVVLAFPYDETAELEFSIGPTKIVERKIYFRNLFNVNLIQAICTMSFIFCLFFISYFFSFSATETKYLFFSFLCLSLGLSYMNIFYEHDANNELILERLTRSSFPFASFFLTAFIMKYTNTLNKNKYFIIMLVPTLVFSIWNLTMPHKSDVQKFFIHTSNFAITPQLILSIILLSLNIFKNKNKNALIILTALLIVVGVSLRDIYFVNNSITPYCWLVPYAFLLLCISILFILITEQTETFKKAQLLSAEIFEKNSLQSEIIDGVSSLTKNINESGKVQNTAISETIAILNRYEANNNTIVSDIIKEIDELEKTIISISENIKKSGRNVLESINEQLNEVAQINDSINELNSHINMINENASETNENAKKLITYANNSKTIINSSINYIREIQNYSKFIEDLLNS